MSAKNKIHIPEKSMEYYQQLIQTVPGIELKGKNNPYTSHNGHMFTFLSREGVLAIRLPKEEREKFLKEYNTTLMESYGAVMKEYVKIPDDRLSDIVLLSDYLKISFNYIKTLKPKPSKKK